MINNPDLQLNTTINRWITGILLFSFELVHVPALKYTGADGLSRRPAAEEDPPDDDDHEDRLANHSYLFGIILLNDRACVVPNSETCVKPYASLGHGLLTRPSTLLTCLGVIETATKDETIPRSEMAEAKDLKLRHIQQFLTDRWKPTMIADEDYKAFVLAATRYFILESNLWQWHPQGKHQLVVPEGKHYRILNLEAHDNLSHKGIFTTQTRLLLCFWWPHITDDIKWYIRT
jgi:hypothetical protein